MLETRKTLKKTESLPDIAVVGLRLLAPSRHSIGKFSRIAVGHRDTPTCDIRQVIIRIRIGESIEVQIIELLKRRFLKRGLVGSELRMRKSTTIPNMNTQPLRSSRL